MSMLLVGEGREGREGPPDAGPRPPEHNFIKNCFRGASAELPRNPSCISPADPLLLLILLLVSLCGLSVLSLLSLCCHSTRSLLALPALAVGIPQQSFPPPSLHRTPCPPPSASVLKEASEPPPGATLPVPLPKQPLVFPSAAASAELPRFES